MRDVLDFDNGWNEDRNQQNELLKLFNIDGVVGYHVPLPGPVVKRKKLFLLAS